MKKMLTENLGLKILALVFSIALWFVSININDPVSSDSYTVTVQLQNMDQLTDAGKYVEVTDNSDRIRVTVRGSRSVLASFSNSNIVATADLTKMTADNEVPIEISTNKLSDELESIKADAEYLTVNVENLDKVQMPINVNVQNEPAEGYVIGSCTTSQNLVLISGPESVVSQVASADVDINVDGATSDVNISLPIHLLDADGDEVDTDKLTLNKNEVATTATILEVKEIPVVCTITGNVLDGYVVDDEIAYSPSIMTIVGKPSAVKNISSVDIDDPIDITGAEGDIVTDFDINNYLPDGVYSYDSVEGIVTVTVHIEKAAEQEVTIEQKHIHVTNVPEGYNVELNMDEDPLTLTLTGMNEDLQQINTDDLVVMLDIEQYMKNNELESLKAGTYDIPATLVLDNGVKLAKEVKVPVKVSVVE